MTNNTSCISPMTGLQTTTGVIIKLQFATVLEWLHATGHKPLFDLVYFLIKCPSISLLSFPSVTPWPYAQYI